MAHFNAVRAIILLALSSGLAFFLSGIYSDLHLDHRSLVANRAVPPRRPNVIYLQHESLSGALLLNTAKGRAATPFFQKRMRTDPNFYVFQHHRAPSGNTIDALPALLTGCLPFAKKGVKFVQTKGRSVGYQFAAAGYRTASFSSRGLDETIKKGQWKMLYDILVGGMDRVENPFDNLKMSLDNGQGSSDGQMLPVFEEWLAELAGKGERDPSAPFYAQFYNFNQHYPYLKKKTIKRNHQRPTKHGKDYYASLKHTDLFLEGLFDILSRTGHLDNTVIVGSSDHGDDPFKVENYVRLSAWDSYILHGVAYVYYPGRLIENGGLGGYQLGQRLRMNTQRLTSTLDMFQTLLSILHGADDDAGADGHRNHPLTDPATAAAEGCIVGIDLTAVDVPNDRVVFSENLASAQFDSVRLWAISTKDGSLYHRQAKRPYMPLQQGNDNTYVLLDKGYSGALDNRWKEYFRRAIISLRGGSSFVGEEVKGGELVRFFVKVLGGESAVEATREAMPCWEELKSSRGITEESQFLARNCSSYFSTNYAAPNRATGTGTAMV